MVNCVLSHPYWVSFWPGVKEINEKIGRVKYTFLHTKLNLKWNFTLVKVHLTLIMKEKMAKVVKTL